MSVVEHFISRWHQLERNRGDGRTALPDRIAVAAADTLTAEGGAVICLHDTDGVRLTIGTSSAPALKAEQLEYTLGDGPGFHAQSTASTVLAGHHFGRRWPVFHEALLSHTPFRSARAVPLTDPATDWPAVLLLYYREVGDVHDADIADPAGIADVADVIACALMCTMTELAGQLRRPNGAGLPHHLEQRLAVSVATGMLVGSRRLVPADALDVLRGHAYAQDTTLDNTAFQVVTGQLDSHTL